MPNRSATHRARCLLGRRLCRLGLHRWSRTCVITGRHLRGSGPHRVAYWVTTHRYGSRCRRAYCQTEIASA